MYRYYFESIRKNKLKLAILLISTVIFSFCKEDPQVWQVKSEEQNAGQYIESNPGQFSEFNKLVEITGMGPLLNIRGPFTIFLPTDEAMIAYYQEMNVKSLDEFRASFLDSLIRNHIVTNEITTGDIGLGALQDTNAIGDYVATEFDGSEIILSKSAKIIKRDIRTANGYIHIIDKVLPPITKDVYMVVASDPSYKIFAEGLELTGLKDTLQLVSFKFGKKVARTRFTLLVVPDTIFNRYGIYDVNDLIAWCGADPDSLTFLDNPFYRYMEYHCLNGSFYLSDFSSGIYSILSRDNNINVTIDSDYRLNLDSKTRLYTGFIIPASNTPANNGAVHAINDLLPVIDPEPAVIIFETTDFFDMKQGDYYLKNYMRWGDGANTFEKIKWQGDYMLYYFKGSSGLINSDCLSMLGWWSVSVTFPKVMKGKYKVSIFQPGWNDVTDCKAFIDGESTPYKYTGPYGSGVGGLQQIADVDFKTTTEHTITLTNTAIGMLFWDYVRFDPVK